MTKKNELNQPCECGSNKKAGDCCKKGLPCSCGSGKPAAFCCYREEE
ncbi:MAG: hypothetical protein ABII07_02150 [Patescibacteria group bacterium]|nr:hypothetical protein [Patescibacteria group bacterium]